MASDISPPCFIHRAPLCLSRLCGPLSSSSSSLLRIVLCRLLSRTNFLPLSSFISLSALFLFQLLICIAGLPFSISSFLYFAIFCLFVIVVSTFFSSSVSRRLFNLFFFSKSRADLSITTSTFLRSLHTRLCCLMFLTSAFYVHKNFFLNLRWPARWSRCLLRCLHKNLYLNLRWTAQWSYMFRILPIHPLKCLSFVPVSGFRILLENCVRI